MEQFTNANGTDKRFNFYQQEVPDLLGGGRIALR